MADEGGGDAPTSEAAPDSTEYGTAEKSGASTFSDGDGLKFYLCPLISYCGSQDEEKQPLDKDAKKKKKNSKIALWICLRY